MDKLGIKREDIIDITDEDTNIFLDVKKEEDDNECIFIEDDDDVELLEVIPSKTEKNVYDCTRGNFETIFLPEMYAGVAVETPFFDINSYSKKYGPSRYNEDEVDKPDLYMNSNPLENNVHQSIIDSIVELKEGLQIRNENIYNTCTPIIYKNCCGDNQPRTLNERYTYKYRRQTTDDMYVHRTPMNSEVERGSEFSNVKPASSLVANNMFQQDKQIQSQNFCDNHNRNMLRSDEKLLQAAKTYKSTKNNWAEKFSSSAMRSLVSSSKRSDKDLTEDSKYKCPICKANKTFDTLLAVNNHLKFAHISFFSSGRDKLK